MSTHIRAVRASKAKAKPNTGERSSRSQRDQEGWQPADASPQAQRMLRLQQASPQARQMLQLQRAADASPQVQRVVQLQAMADGSAVTAGSQARPRGPGTALPGNVRAKMERGLGMDFSSVRIHQGPEAKAMSAIAYTQGRDIHFAQGQYRPHSLSGQELLGHELAHVVQQAQGRVRATRQMKGVGLNDDDRLEREADAMGRAAALGSTVGRALVARPSEVPDLQPSTPNGEAPIQRVVVPGFAAAGNQSAQAQAATVQELEAAYDAAWAHLWTNPTARQLYTVAHAHANTVFIKVGGTNTHVSRNQQRNWDMDFHPWLFGAFRDQPRGNLQNQVGPHELTGTISAAMLLMHEFGHVQQDIEAEQFNLQFQLAGAGVIWEMTPWLNGIHNTLLGLYPYAGLPVPNLPHAHNEVMEDDNVTRHERPAQVAMGEPPRENYHNTVVFDDLDRQGQRIMSGMGLDPALPATNLPQVVGRAVNLHHVAVPHNVSSILTHIVFLRGEIQRLLATGRLAAWRQGPLLVLDAHLVNATAFWNNQVAVLQGLQTAPAARAAPTFQNP